MTDQYKAEAKRKHVLRVLAYASDPLDRAERTDLVSALMKKLEPHLPPDVTARSPESYADRFDEFASAYVSALDHFGQMLRSW